jgi:hypothetical protein
MLYTWLRRNGIFALAVTFFLLAALTALYQWNLLPFRHQWAIYPLNHFLSSDKISPFGISFSFLVFVWFVVTVNRKRKSERKFVATVMLLMMGGGCCCIMGAPTYWVITDQLEHMEVQERQFILEVRASLWSANSYLTLYVCDSTGWMCQIAYTQRLLGCGHTHLQHDFTQNVLN